MEFNTVGWDSRPRAWSTVLLMLSLLIGLSCITGQAQSSGPPLLSIRPSTPNQVQVAWTNTAVGFALERADALSSQTQWRTVMQSPAALQNQFMMTLPTLGANSFFRLSEARLMTIANTSPFSGEQGVAVTRETIVWLTAPLATNAVVNLNNFHADLGGRRILSRVELSSDRSKATLFYLEPLPASARINVVMDGTGLTDSSGRPVDLDGDGQEGGQAVIAFDTLSITPVVGTAIRGQVFASELMPGADTGSNAVNRPLENVTITVDGMEETVRAKTDAQGNFTLDPCPPGEFFVKIDGRTATGSRWPNGDYYPYVGKAWMAAAGRKDNLAGGTGQIFLPLIKAGTLQTVSASSNTVVTFPAAIVASNPALAGVSITVPANSLFSDNGTRGGKVGIAPVPPDRLPGPLPPGLEMPIVITVQTDGPLNFDRPAPVCFPNLPDPILGKPLPAGSKQSLVSFNHKKGVWESVGSMTVSADGKFVCSDPDVGILQPGWHGVGPPPTGPPPPPCDGNGPSPALVSTRARSGLLSLAQPAFGSACHLACIAAFEKCIDDARKKYGMSSIHCYNTNKSASVQATCAKQRFDDYNTDKVFCKIDLDWCEDKCQVPPPPPPPPPPPKPPKPKPKKPACRPKPKGPNASTAGVQSFSPQMRIQQNTVVQQLDLIFDQIEAVANPYAGSSAPWPAAVAAQIAQLSDQADSLAGGDAGVFLQDYALQEEIEAAAAGTLEEPDGNAPDYPVLYLAQVLRPGGMFELRGKTEPYGQYALFLPRDGVLLSVRFYDPDTKSLGIIYPRLRPDAPWQLPSFTLVPLSPAALDSDHDGLPDAVESVYGTDPFNPDTGNKGITDGAAVDLGLDPLGGLPAQTGVIASTKTPGPALDVCTWNGLAIVGATSGVSVFSLAENSAPTLAAQITTTGSVRRVSCTGNFIAAAQGPAGLAFIDITDLNQSILIHQLGLGDVRAVATSDRTAYAGLDNGLVIQLDVPSGVELDRVTITNAVSDIAFDGDYLYVLDATRLHVLKPINGHLTWIGSALSPYTAAPNAKLSLGGGLAYAVHARGYNTFDLTNPAQPVLIQAGNTTQFGWKQIVPNGSGLGLAVVGPNGGDSSPHTIGLYDVADPKKTDVYLTTFTTPGIAQAVSLYNGKAYVAADSAGLVVVNYLPYDNKGIPPAVSLALDFPSSGVEEGTLARVIARTTDDVQTRAVEFYVDDVNVFSAGHFPFEYRFVTPALNAGKTAFRLRAKAIDTGGNSTWSEEVTVSLLPDNTPPRIISINPGNRSVSSALSSINLFFSEPTRLGTLAGTALQVLYAGPDHKFGTTDDQPIAGGLLSSRQDVDGISITFSAGWPVGQFRLTASGTITDLRGIAIGRDYVSTFWILPGGAEGDADDDELMNGDETDFGTNPVVADTDGDGWLDGIEVDNGSDPLDSKSLPRTTYMAPPQVTITLQLADDAVTSGITLARPPMLVHLNDALEDGLTQHGPILARPPTTIQLQSAADDGVQPGVTLAKPPTTVHLQSGADDGLIQPGPALARPPLSIKFPQ